ncbi:hypothetical protein [Novosphingobium humi]|uniref:Uncharacterized protein n=1 Tax=Novosphingobium humi TaxID=2282397 RepID=A0ABY7TUS0_9SPHN|nr:hypothetical protein [Novosphingobium humi]WCT76680.1 hypothetical protein PQ457_12150 [Novosphingobium humi]
MSITIRRDSGKKNGRNGSGKSYRLWWLSLVLMLAGGLVALAWIKGGPMQMREVAVELSTRQVGVNGQVK